MKENEEKIIESRKQRPPSECSYPFAQKNDFAKKEKTETAKKQ